MRLHLQFSAEQLAAHNIDVNNLTDASIQQIVQIAMPSLDMQVVSFFFTSTSEELICRSDEGENVLPYFSKHLHLFISVNRPLSVNIVLI